MELHTTQIEKARIGMHGRILRCPVGDNPEDCPLHEIRRMPIEARLAWLESKSDQEVVDLYRRHTECLERKLSDLSN